MDIDTFIKNFEDQFDDTKPGTIKPATKFRDLEDWSSLGALSLIAMVDEQYNIKLTGNDIRNSLTIKDLFNIVQSRK